MGAWRQGDRGMGREGICVNLRVMSCLPGPHGHKVAVLQSYCPMNRAQEPRLRGDSFVAVALHATAGLVSEHTRRLFTGHLS